jgi:uronate dehydrogenase
MSMPETVAKTVAIIGAAGLVGSALRPELSARGYRLVLVDRRPATDVQPGERSVPCDILDTKSLEIALAGCDGVVHLAACTTDAAWPEQVRQSVEGTISLYEAARAAGVRRVVYASSHHVMGFHPRGGPVGSFDMLLPDSRYGVGKAFGESIAALFACKYGIATLVVRIGNVNTRPIDRRRLGNWTSHRDLGQLVAIGLEHPDLLFDIVYGISDASGRSFDNSRAHALGYRPQDAPDPWEAQVLAEDPPPSPGSEAAAAPAEATMGGQHSQSEFEGAPARLARLPRRT